MANLVTVGNLGDEFDLGNNVADRITLKLGSNIFKEPTGEINTSASKLTKIFFNTATLLANATSNAVTNSNGYTISSFNNIGASISGGLINLPQGDYRIDVLANNTSTNARFSTAIDFIVDGNIIANSRIMPQNYTRVTESHSEASTSGFDILTINNTLDFRFVQMSGGNGGTKTLLNTSKIILTQL